jgi:hypothetical protein
VIRSRLAAWNRLMWCTCSSSSTVILHLVLRTQRNFK